MGFFYERSGWPWSVGKVSTNSPIRDIMPYSKKVQTHFSKMFVDPRFEDEAISALMEEALSEDLPSEKFDLDEYFNSEIDYA